MTRKFRFAALHLALAAMLLRALIPAGWMPGPANEGAAFVICTLDGAVHDAGDPAHKPADDGHHDDCPFAAAPHLAAPLAIASLTPPSYAIAAAVPSLLRRRSVQAADYAPQSPRAPPPAV